MPTLPLSDLRRLQASLRTLYASRTEAALLPILPQTIAGLIPVEVCTYSEYFHQGPQPTGRHGEYPALFIPNPKVPELIASCVEENRLFQALWDRAPLQKVATLWDIALPTYWHRSRLYNELYLAHDVPFLISTRAYDDGHRCLAIGLHRKREFVSQECTLLHTLQPHLNQALLNAQRVTQFEAQQAATGLAATHLPQIAVSLTSQGRILWMTARARAVLGRYTTARRWPPTTLPDPFRAWLRHLEQELADPDVAPGAQPTLSLQQGARTLTLRVVFQEAQRLLLGEETSGMRNWEAVAPYGLTSREREVLQWVLEGKTAPEIGQIVGASASTIQKHLGNLYRKFGVEQRSALVAAVWELLHA